ncbi:MAG: TatD family hydrolase [Promethearchaeota archaeon]
MLIDVHCHLNLYLAVDQVIKDALKTGVEKIISVAMSVKSQERILELSREFENVYPALGIHPEEVQMNKNILKDVEKVLEFIKKNSNEVCCIGEIGLDHYFIKDKSTYSIQKIIFEKMLSLAEELKLPVNIHSKGAEDVIFETLPSFKIPNINVHWYSGPEKYLRIGIERGYYFSITPAIDYSPAVKKTVMEVDIEHLLLESDGPVRFAGKIGTPSMIKNVIKKIAEYKNLPLDILEKQIQENTFKVFPKIV